MKKYLNYQTLYLSLIMLCLISCCGAIVYRFYSLNNIGVAISLILAIILFIIIQRFNETHNRQHTTDNTQQTTHNRQQKNKTTILNFLLLTSYFLLLTLSFYILFTSQTNESIISPWQVAPNYFFLLYSLATVILIIITIKSRSSQSEIGIPTHTSGQLNNLTIFLISMHYFLSFSICWIVYKIGYGFDPFIHQATMDLINKTGAVYPKPFYYLGQYSLIIILHKITFIPIEWLNKLLVPVMASVYLPATIYYVLSKWFEDNKANLLLIIALLIFPFSFFILTTPQNLAYLLLILIIFLGLSCYNTYELAIIYLLAFTAMLIQPIAGIPAVLFAALLTVYYSDKAKINPAPFRQLPNSIRDALPCAFWAVVSPHQRCSAQKARGLPKRRGVKKYLYLLIFVLVAISLPSAFYIFEKNGAVSNLPQVAAETSINTWNLLKFNIPEQENFILNFIYLYWFNLKIIIGLISATGIAIACHNLKYCRFFSIYLIMSAGLGLSYLITKKLSFEFLIEYERGNYPDRILLISAFFLAPFIITSLYWLINRILEKNKIIKLIFLIFASVLISTSLYLSYPRFDDYFNSHCHSTSDNDIEAVNWIDNQAENDYIVLANQQVSAAALREFGFKKYYSPNNKSEILNLKSEIFYYSVPTGGPLYQYYLDMVYKKPSRETMEQAMNLAGVSEGYFVLNKYWWAFNKILEEAKLEADSWEEIGDGDVFVFRYSK